MTIEIETELRQFTYLIDHYNALFDPLINGTTKVNIAATVHRQEECPKMSISSRNQRVGCGSSTKVFGLGAYKQCLGSIFC